MSFYTPVAEIPKIVAELRESFQQGVALEIPYRKKQLLALARMCTDNEEQFAEALKKDLNKPKAESVLFDIRFVAGEVARLLEHIDEWATAEAPTVPLLNKLDGNRLVRDPLGVVLVIGAWNFPLMVSLCPMAGAIAAGNTVIVKPSELASHTAQLLSKLLPAYLDPKAYRVVNGGISETSALLEQRFDSICYTGGGAVAKIIMKAAANHLTPVLLELGGKNPVYVAEDADLAIAARRILWGRLLNAGQTCLSPDYVLIDKKLQPAFLEAARAALNEFYGPDPKASPDLSRIINDAHWKRLSALLTSGTVAIGGQTDAATRYIAPTILVDVPHDAPVMQNEVFGPILPIINVSSIDEAIKFITSRDKPLATYLFTRNSKLQDEFLKRTSSGSTCVNDTILQGGVHGLPFGGVGASGMGSYHGKYSFEAFSHLRAVVYKNPGMEIVNTIRYPPYSDKKISWVSWLMIPVPKAYSASGAATASMFKVLLLAAILAFVFKLNPQVIASIRHALGF
ncbi:aldehyde dehydrogenase type III-PG [Capsaspora owczarzaki ATCC 30864]|uniref:Aldehyde dehydrogenase n=2 Tax=Capsaspora owczarzaki (strain ATCC 30864) TaxID=595528 RepID=A0A0D2WWL8_CAPO3|nr:aldehyde dehydrogenase type III-PG [Capsaspora owczarzaki ATCC 30864]